MNDKLFKFKERQKRVLGMSGTKSLAVSQSICMSMSLLLIYDCPMHESLLQAEKSPQMLRREISTMFCSLPPSLGFIVGHRPAFTTLWNTLNHWPKKIAVLLGNVHISLAIQFHWLRLLNIIWLTQLPMSNHPKSSQCWFHYSLTIHTCFYIHAVCVEVGCSQSKSYAWAGPGPVLEVPMASSAGN